MKLKFLFISIGLLILFVGCSKNSDINPTYESAIGIVSNPNNAIIFTFHTDEGKRLVLKSTKLTSFKPSTGKRLIIYYTILSENASETEIELVDVREVAIKTIVPITEKMQDSIGYDPLLINAIYISSNYLNFDFSYMGGSVSHLINVVRDSVDYKTLSDTITLEFRHNKMSDESTTQKIGFVSTDLSPLKNFTDKSDSIVLFVKTYEFSQTEPITYSFKYRFD